MFPPVPPWEGLHVLVVHLPIGLLLVAPLFVLLATVFPRWAGWSALIVLVLGTAGAWVAVSTGEAARDMVEDGPDAMWAALEKHEELAEQARNAFTAVTVVYAIILLLPLVWKKMTRLAAWVPVNLALLVALMGANLLLANAAHQGGLLVHLYGVHAALGVELPEAADSEVTETPVAEESPPAAAPEKPVEPAAAPEAEKAPEAQPAPEAEQPATAPK